MKTFKVIIKTVVISLIFFLILIFIAKENLFTGQLAFNIEPHHVVIALIPFIILLIVSGKLEEIKGPGGIGLTIRNEVQKSISPELIETKIEVDPATVQTKGSIGLIQNQIAATPPTTLSFEIGKKNYYVDIVIEQYIEELKKYPDFRFILFTNTDGKFMGYMKADDFNNLLESTDIVQVIEGAQILKDPRAIRDSIPISSTNKEALDKMDKVNVSMLPVINGEEKFIGVITQEEIVRKILTRALREA